MASPKSRIQEYSSGLDWLTLTAFSSDLQRREFRAFVRDLKRELVSRGEMGVEMKAGEYQGQNFNGIRLLTRPRDNHDMIAASGEATPVFAALAVEKDLCGKCTRIDAQITARLEKPDPKFAQKIRDTIRKLEKAQGRTQQTPLATHEAAHGDEGIGIGNRKSAIYGRVYDWDLKHRKERNSVLWRLEAELKQEAAITGWSRYRESRNPGRLCAEMVATRFEKWGVKDPAFLDLEKCVINGTRPLTDAEGRMRHAENMVVPFLSKIVEDGNRDALIELFARYGLLDVSGVFLGDIDGE